MAFQWVADNITDFGGDAQNIMGFGESSGAGDLSDWLAAEISEIHFIRRSIAQSPSNTLGGDRPTLADEQKIGSLLIDRLGIEDEISAERIRLIPAEEILAVAELALPGHYYHVVVDGQTMSERPIESLERVQAAAVDVLVGTNADEWYMYIDANATRADLEKWVDENAPEHAEALLADVEGETGIRRAMDRMQTASAMLCPARYFAAKLSELGGRGWVYYFSRQRPGSGGEKLGAYHGTEIPYVFDMHDDWLPTEAVDRVLTEAVMDYWVQFARTGDPNLPGRPEWPLYTAEHPMVMELGDRIGAMEAHDQALCDLLGPVRPDIAGEPK